MSEQLSNFFKVFDAKSLNIYLYVLLFFGFLDLIVWRIFLHLPGTSATLVPIVPFINNFQAVVQVPILVSIIYVLWKKKNSNAARIISGFSFILLVTMIPLYYFSLASIRTPAILWVSFLFIAPAIIFTASAKRIFAVINKSRSISNFILVIFLVLATLTYIAIYFYFISLNLISHFGIRISEPVTLFALAQTLLLGDTLVLFLYSTTAPCKNLRFDRKIMLKVLLLPSLIVFLLLGALLAMPTGSRFDMPQIIALILSLWGFRVPKLEVFLYPIMFWFFLVAALLLKEKARISKQHIYSQEFIAVFLMFFSGFLDTSQYLLMGVIAIILFSTEMTLETPLFSIIKSIDKNNLKNKP